MTSSFYKSSDEAGQPLNTAYAEDVGQLIDVLTGQRDPGALSLLPQLAAPAAPTVTLSAGSVTGTGYQWGIYWITGILDGTGAARVAGRTTAGTLTVAQPLTSQQATVDISGLAAPTGAIGWGVVRNKSGGGTWYEVPGSEQFLTLAGTMPSQFVDDTADSSLTTAAPTSNTTGASGGWATVKLWDSADAGVTFPAASITTATLPQTFTHLLVVASFRSNQAAYQDTLRMRINGDTGSDYLYQATFSDGASVTAGASSPSGVGYINLGGIAAATTSANASSGFRAELPAYTAATYHTAICDLAGTDSGGAPEYWQVVGQWNPATPAAITSLTFYTVNGSMTDLTQITVYGLA